MRQNTLPVGLGRRLGVDVQDRLAGCARHWRARIAQIDPSFSSRFEAASVLISSTFLPASASVSAVAAANDVCRRRLCR